MAGTLMKIACVMVACMVVFAPHANAISCGQVTSGLAPCLGYLRNGGSLPASCCNGVKGLSKAATTTADKKTACGCIKSLSGSIKGIKPALASGLPGKCGVSIPYKISPSTDCSKIK
uniref:Non-specific lipid-transfer protein n=1 Tax=Tanacetum cinerariifolium TaxID=118510 RepID=A0A6L2NFX3_TANCI|nr:non-specific lipid-transfer protein-like [Tanacetum cinerariifolium]